MATVLDTFITRFGFETDRSGLDKAEKGLSNFKSSALKIAAAVGGILGGGLFLNSIANVADETLKWADANGIVIQSLGELEFAVQRQGGSIEGLRSSLSNINRAIGEVERGTGRAKLAFEDYGLQVRKSNGTTKTADELFTELNKKFATLSRAQQFDLATKMGIDRQTIRLLQTAPDEVARLRLEAAKLGVLTRQDAARAAEFNDGLTNMAQAINAIKFEIAGVVFEPLARLFKRIADGVAFFRRHKDIMLTLIGIITAVGAAYAAMAIKATAAWLAAFLPINVGVALIGLLVGAIAILAEDFHAFFTGANSATGDFLKNFPALEKGFRALGDTLGFLLFQSVEGFKMWWEWLGIIGNGIISFLLDPINSTIDAMSTLFNWLDDIGNAIIEFILNPVDKVVAGFEKISKLSGSVASFFGFDGDVVVGGESSVNINGAQIGPSAPPPGSITSNRIIRTESNRSFSVENLNVDARGGDSKEIAQNIGDALAEELKNTVENFDSKVDR